MRTKAVLVFGVISLAAASAAQALSVDELIAKNAAARGGLDKIEAIKTLKAEGKMRFIGGFGSIDLSFVQYKQAPDSVRTEATVQGLTQVQSWDGKEAWQISPFQGRRDPERMSADDAKSMADDAPIAGSLIGYKERGDQVEYLGTEDVDGTNAYKLKVTFKNGDVEYVYLDPDHYVEIRTVGQRKVRGTLIEDINDFGDYELVAGVYFPFSVDSRTRGDGGETVLTVEKAQANAPLDATLFAYPSTPQSATPKSGQ